MLSLDLLVGLWKGIGYNKIKERRKPLDTLTVYRKVKRWKFPLGRGVGFGPTPLNVIRNPLEFQKRDSNQRKI
jgi:hypothetical protein